ncbi:MAG: SGNH/GDSL hydrolase family protein [Alistipes sp.]|nr:SGNH/GDSL hydrolase family protein [Alistipes sp.]
MKKIIVIAVALVATISAMAGEKRWVDALDLGIHGRTQVSEKSPYHRFDPSLYNFTHKTIIDFSKMSSGLYLSFKTDASDIWASWENVPRQVGDNRTGTMQLSVELYVKVDGKWTFASVARISTKAKANKRTKPLIKNLPEGEKECLLYLPMWCEVTSLEVGVNEGATIVGTPSPFRHKVIVHGSSITHGASAARAGLTYTAQLSRNLGINFVNFGFSGLCKMQPEFLETLKACEADAFLFDAFSNPSSKQISERLEGWVEELVKAHPGKPLIFLQTPIHNTLDTKMYATRMERIELVRAIMGRLTKKYKDVYFLEVKNVTGEEGTIDAVHPNDLGFYRFVNAYQPKIAKILKKYGIK